MPCVTYVTNASNVWLKWYRYGLSDASNSYVQILHSEVKLAKLSV